MTQGGGTINTSHFRHIADRALDVLLPPQCLSCIAAVESPGVLCGACVRNRPPFQRARAVMVYGDFSRKIVLALKHGDRTDTAPAAN